MHVNGGKHVLEHGGHQFDLHAVRAKVVEDEEGVVSELLLVHAMLLQRRDDVFGERILRRRRGNVLETKKIKKIKPRWEQTNPALHCVAIIHLEHPEIQHGTFGESAKPLKAQGDGG